MRKDSNKKGGLGKAVAKQNLPSKVCVVCERPFTWRKKWETVWDEVTTCSKSCNAKRRQRAKQESKKHTPSEDALVSLVSDDSGNESDNHHQQQAQQQGIVSTSHQLLTKEREQEDFANLNSRQAKKLLRQQHKQTVKAQKEARRQKRMGATPEVGRKPCDLCQERVDLLVRCTIDASRHYRMVCGKCWPTVSGGVPDGSPDFPHYTYGGLWKNRNAPLKKRIGSGAKNKNKPQESISSSSSSSLLEEIQASAQTADDDGGSVEDDDASSYSSGVESSS